MGEMKKKKKKEANDVIWYFESDLSPEEASIPLDYVVS